MPRIITRRRTTPRRNQDSIAIKPALKACPSQASDTRSKHRCQRLRDLVSVRTRKTLDAIIGTTVKATIKENAVEIEVAIAISRKS
jgi:hypothetical protein